MLPVLIQNLTRRLIAETTRFHQICRIDSLRNVACLGRRTAGQGVQSKFSLQELEHFHPISFHIYYSKLIVKTSVTFV